MKKIVLAFAFIGLLIGTQVALANTLNNTIEITDEKCDKCGKKDCKHKKAETDKKNCTATKSCCAKKTDDKAEAKTETKKSCCAHNSAKSCSKTTTENKDDKK